MVLLVERYDVDGVTTLVLNRPDKLNALTVGLFSELRSHVECLSGDIDVRCVVIRGAGNCFSAGHDLNDIGAGEDVPSPGWHSETLEMLGDLPQPVIAAVHGHCYTGALEVALACDFIVAAENARFADTHSRWALTPIWGMSQRLPRRVGEATAKWMMFTADTLKAAEAHRIGLVQAIWPESDFFDEVAALAQRISKNSPFTHRANKQLIRMTSGMSLGEGLRWEVEHCEGVGPDMQDRLRAFETRKS